jgi:photosystem II stability/assembly factor-like uncharacterized protein
MALAASILLLLASLLASPDRAAASAGQLRPAVTATVVSGDTWVVSHVPSDSVTSIACADTDDCLVITSAGSTGAIFETSDGGATWTKEESAYPATSLADISCALGTSDCWAVGNESGAAIAEYTSNLGASWSSQNMPSSIIQVAGISCASALDCVAVGTISPDTIEPLGDGAAAVTTDAGSKWRVVDTGSLSLSAVSCPTVQACTAIGNSVPSGFIVGTTNGGASWTIEVRGAADGTVLQSVSCPTSSDCVAVGNNPPVVERTRDGGASWTAAEEAVLWPEMVSCPSADVCWTTNSAGTTAGLYGSTNGGATWFPEAPAVDATGSIACPSVEVCFAVGEVGPGGREDALLTTRDAEGIGCTGLLTEPASMIAPVPGGGGYWLASSSGGVTACGTAPFYGAPRTSQLQGAKVVAITAASDGHGYFLLARNGRVVGFGPGAQVHGSGPSAGTPYVGMAVDAESGGYWLVNSGGGVFALGAPYRGSVLGLGEHVTNIVGITSPPASNGYWLATADGGIYSFDLPFHGSLPGLRLRAHDVTTISAAPVGSGYYLFGSNGGVYALGSGLSYCGSGVSKAGTRFGSGAVTGFDGYWLVSTAGKLSTFNAPYDGDPTSGPMTTAYC